MFYPNVQNLQVRRMANGMTDLRSVIVWFESTESMLLDVLNVIPYETAHEGVWSPRLVTVLLETCSQLDSLLKQETMQSTCVAIKKFDIADYYSFFGAYLSGKWVLFWGETPEKLRPFAAWDGVTDYKKTSYQKHPLDWWKAYNGVKHDRIANRRQATLKRAVEAMAALFLSLLFCQLSREAVGDSVWLHSGSHNPKATLDDHLNPLPDQRVVAESKLFSYPVGWMGKPIPGHLLWSGSGSARWNSWFNQQAE